MFKTWFQKNFFVSHSRLSDENAPEVHPVEARTVVHYYQTLLSTSQFIPARDDFDAEPYFLPGLEKNL